MTDCSELRQHLDNPQAVRVPLGPDALRVHDTLSKDYDSRKFWKRLSETAQTWWLDNFPMNSFDSDYTCAHADAELCSRMALAEASTIELQ